MSPIVEIQRRMMELGRIRLGSKGPKGEPRKLDKFRMTSASRALLEAAAELYGGKVQAWENAPDQGYFELFTDSAELDIVLPPVFSDRDGQPTVPYSQWFELWSGGGCQRRCDGDTEMLSGKPCLCMPLENGDERACKPTTRLNVMLPRVPGLGVWRLESHGWNAAALLPGTVEVLMLAAAQQQFIPAVLRLEQRSSKRDGQTRRFIVPVVDLPTIRLQDALDTGQVGEVLGVNPPQLPAPKPALPVTAGVPDPQPFENGEQPGFGTPPPLPSSSSSLGETGTDETAVATAAAAVISPSDSATSTAAAPKPTAPQLKKLNMLVGRLRDEAGVITTDQLWAAAARERNFPAEALIEMLEGRDQLGTLHWSPLRDSLTREEARALIDRLEAFEAKAVA